MDDPQFPIIDLPSEVDTPEAAVRFLVAELVRFGDLPEAASDEVTRQVWQRERLGSTAIGRGVAIPHARIEAVIGPVGVIGRCPRPLDWPEPSDGVSIRLVCLVVGSAGYLLHGLIRLSRQLRGA